MRWSIWLLTGALAAAPAEWTQFRGPNASGVSDATGIPVEFGPEKNVVWKTALPPGHSSPVLAGDRIYLTAYDQDKLLVVALDRNSGRIQWRREVPRPRTQELHKMNSPASPSVVTDGRNAYAFFTDFGLVSYGFDGNERWRLPLGPFNNPFGMGASPILADGKLIQVCDSETGSFIVAVDAKSGKVVWRKERPDMTRGFSTPVLYRSPKDGLLALVTGSTRLTAYDVNTGKEVWWVDGLTWQLKPTPVLGEDVIYVLGWAGGADTGQQENIVPFEEAIKAHDRNGDGGLSAEEAPDPKIKSGFAELDLDHDGVLGRRDWQMYRAKRSAVNAVQAFKLSGDPGDRSEKSLLWRYYKSLPNVPSPLLYRGVLYLMKEGGILTSLDPRTGNVLKQGRLPGALDQYFSSPIGVDGKIMVASQAGHVTVLKAAPEWEVLARNDMDDEVFATPALEDGRIYLRTRSALYCFGH